MDKVYYFVGVVAFWGIIVWYGIPLLIVVILLFISLVDDVVDSIFRFVRRYKNGE